MQQRQLPQAIDRFRDAVAAPRPPFIHQNWANALICWDGSRARAHRVRPRDSGAHGKSIANNAINASLLHRRDQRWLARRALRSR
jgi:hypothetical protein